MYPILFKYKFISIGGYGLMLGTGFYLAFLLFERELKLRNMNPELAYKVLLSAIPCGIIGAKIFHILEHFSEFIMNPIDMIFSGSGLSVYGGYILSLLVSMIIIKKSRESILNVFDVVSPSLALGYCFGRFGCHVAGDGCYGITTFSILGTAYPNGIVPTTIPVMPTPLFEVFLSFVTVGLLLQIRKLDLNVGKIFAIFLLLNGIPRFLVEFIRLNPKLIFNLTQAQVIAIIFILTGITCWIFSKKRKVMESM